MCAGWGNVLEKWLIDALMTFTGDLHFSLARVLVVIGEVGNVNGLDILANLLLIYRIFSIKFNDLCVSLVVMSFGLDIQKALNFFQGESTSNSSLVYGSCVYLNLASSLRLVWEPGVSKRTATDCLVSPGMRKVLL